MANNNTNVLGTRDVFFNHWKRTTGDIYYFDDYWNLSIVKIVMDALLLQLSLLPWIDGSMYCYPPPLNKPWYY